MNYHSRTPLTAAELERRSAVLSANRPIPTNQEAGATDERLYGSKAALILRDAKRSVALASNDARLAVFQQAAATLAEAVAGQWLPKNVMVDRLADIAEAHDFFGRDQGDIHGIIGECSAKVPAPVTSVVLPPLSSLPGKPPRRLISHRASDLKPEKLGWVWPGRIPEGKLVLLGGPPGLGKSQLTAFMSAVVSNGGAWPCGEGSTLPGDVIFMSAEDGIRDTIIPRLMAAGADTTRVHIVVSATKPNGTGRKLSASRLTLICWKRRRKKLDASG